jgi:ABC-2 type transport system permease protein
MSAIGTLLRLRLRRDRIQLSVWVLAIALMTVFTAAAVASEFGTQAERVSVVKLATATPALLAFRGVADGASVGAFFVFDGLTYLAVLAGLMSTFLAVRHSRADEESGRAELIAATSAGRFAPTIATLIEGTIANVAVMVLVFLGLIASGFDAAGSATFGWVLGATGIAFLGVGLLCAQIFSTARAANGCAAAVVGLAYLVRGIADASGTVSVDGLHTTSTWISWLSPIGWAQKSSPFTDNAWWAGLLGVALCVVLVGATLALQGARDTGAGLIAARSGRATASTALRGPLGLAWRLSRGSIIGWGIGALVLAVVAGGLGGTVITLLKGNSSVAGAISSISPAGSGGILQQFVAAMMAFIAILVAGCMLQGIMRLRQDEAAGTTDVVLSTPVGRIRWFLSFWAIGAASAVVILGISGVVMGGVLARSAGVDQAIFGQTVGTAFAQLPAVLIYLSVLSLVFAVAPRLTIGIGWAMLAVGAFLGQFGGLLKLPDWVRSISPAQHTPAVPMAHADFSGAWWMGAIVIVVTIVAAVLVRRRDTVVG